jgi:adenine-specific DNA-methyltransferase
MPKKYIPYYPDTIEGQAILNNVTRTKRILKYPSNNKVYERIQRGLPLYEVAIQECVRFSSDPKASQTSGNSKNLLIRGECISACAYLKSTEVNVDLVYIDPPFASGADYAKKIFIRKNPQLAAEIKKAEETFDDAELRSFEEKMYGDIWNKEDYLNWMYENLLAIKSVMSDSASIFVHIDWHIGAYIKILLDEIFSEDNFRNEIIWWYPSGSDPSTQFNRKHDTIYWYSKGTDWTFNFDEVAIPYTQEQLDRFDEFDSVKNKKFYWNKNPRGEKIKTYMKSGVGEYDVWNIGINATEIKEIGYNTAKPPKLLERIIKACSNKTKNGKSSDLMTVADFFGGSGVTAKVANELGRNFIHVDVGINSIQTTRDRLVSVGAEFDVLNVQDGVNLFRNPIQTMDKLATLLPGFHENVQSSKEKVNKSSLAKFWFGHFTDSKLGQIPVYVPNLLDHNQKVLDIPIINEIVSQELPKLEEIKKVVVYYIDLSDEENIKDFISDNNATEIEVELRDLKQVLDEVVVTDQVEYLLNEVPAAQNEDVPTYEITINKFISDRLIQKITEYNQKKDIAQTFTSLIGDAVSAETEEDNTDEPTGKRKKKTFKRIEISESGLELIELISLDCTTVSKDSNSVTIWDSTTEIKIDKYGYVIENGEKTKLFWDGKIKASLKPLRMKIRNIAGDESITVLSPSVQQAKVKKQKA